MDLGAANGIRISQLVTFASQPDQTDRYGPVLGGLLRQFLSLRTAAAFQRARSLGVVEVSLFALPGRQGLFALTQEACDWHIKQRHAAQQVPPEAASTTPTRT